MSASSTLNLRRVGREIAQCQHIRLSGLRCGSPALRGHKHCYYHAVIRQERPTATIPQLDDGLNIQFSLREIVQGIAVGKWDTKRAALLLYAMQIAASNLRAARAEIQLARFDGITELPKARQAHRSPAPKKPVTNVAPPATPPQPKSEPAKNEPTLESALLTLQAAALKPPTIPIASEIASTNGAHKSSA